MKKNQLDIGIVTSPFLLKAGVPPVSNLIDILSFFSSDLYLISGSDGIALSNKDHIHICLIEHEQEKNIYSKVMKFLVSNLKISYRLTKLSNVDLWFFFIGERVLSIPMLIAKLLGKNVIFVSSGSLNKFATYNKNILDIIMIYVVDPINYVLSDKITISSDRLISKKNLLKHKNKIFICSEHFVDPDKFKTTVQFNERGTLIGYIGRLDVVKGILNLIEAMPDVVTKTDNIHFLVGGDGPLRGEIKEYFHRYDLNDSAEYIGWISHDNLPKYLNNLKLIVIPSYSETGPQIMFEAMSCGTPVLVTPVGLAPDVIKDSETGFIMENNSPECIARNIIRALKHPDLEKISMNARNLAEKEFTYEAAVERYKGLFENI
ncbi:glycosyltransferase family 4 protein [Methanosarcina mazei]|uniref:Glycosyltransferase family 4 protein n=1 Tax=Methanosarcina mazei TaxID=2209 RepID=A0A6C0VLA2_METMZ|nr:glycosyltransferase family 4 protein [Methanosarcina mazei]QIB91935.1 glycosyltransferase family 4 protein [Methanosarcina mazei]